MYVIKDGTIRISVRNLVEFIFSSGDIDNRTGSSPDVLRMQEGARIHRAIQRKAGADYKPEVSIKMDFNIEHDEKYVVTLEGRADGIITVGNEDDLDVTIDEIKTVSVDVNRMEEAVYVHKAQAMCYAYMYAVDNDLKRINVRMTYVNVDSEEIKYFYEDLEFDRLEKWFFELLYKFTKWTDFVFNERRIRNESIKGKSFPFEYRKGQKNLAATVYKCCESEENLYIQAPTGTGKTISTVYPAVMAMGEGKADKIFYLTAKTITRTIAEDTYEILRKSGMHFRTVTITARDKVCILDERDCNPDKCPYAKGHYDRVNDAVYDLITNEIAIDRDKIIEYANKHKVCPFEMSLDVSLWCDGIICDYNYVFDPNVRLKRFFADGDKGDYVFLIDEAHNLVDRGRSMYSAQLKKEDFLSTKKILKNIDKRVCSALDKCNKILLEMKRECVDFVVYSQVSEFVLNLERCYQLLQKCLDKNRSFEQRDMVMEFFLEIRHFINMHDLLSDKYVIYSTINNDDEFVLNLFCVDPSDNLKYCCNQGRAAIFFSATLLPIQYYKEMLTGDLDEKAIYANSIFSQDKRALLIGNDVSSKYTRRNENEYIKIARYILLLAGTKDGNYLVFFPSHKFMRDVQEVIEKMCEKDQNFAALHDRILCQKNSMNEQEREEFLDAFSDDSNVIGFCVMGGIFSEGIDLKNDKLIGAVVVGTGLPMVCTEQKILQQYFDDNGKNGFDYAYVYPGMNKVMQAAGRVIRTEDDKGIIALLDERFLRGEYLRIFPREWSDYKVVNVTNVRHYANAFWELQ